MKKQIFHLQEFPEDPFRVEQTEPLIIWTIYLGPDVLAMPELDQLIEKFYFSN